MLEINDDDVTPFWKQLIKHIDETWKRKKGVPFYFRPRMFRELKELCRIYTTFGVMAMWDLYLGDSSDEFVRAAGYSFEMFCNKIPKLLDMGWKLRMKRYEDEFLPAYPKVIEDLAREIASKKADPDDNAVPPGSAVPEEKGQT